MSLQDWAKPSYMGEDIDGFRHMIALYGSTITIALAGVNLRTVSVPANTLDHYKEFIEDTTIEFEAHLKLIDEKLDAIVAKDTEGLCSDSEQLRQMEHERISSKACRKIIAQLSRPTEQTQRKTGHHDGVVDSSVSTLGMISDETLQGIIRYSGQGRLREAETLSQKLQLEQFNQVTNKELYGESANNDISSSSD
ncbi:unnamed protein product [Penicillium crustosum]